MKWKIEAQKDVVIATMLSNPVNKMNLEFLTDMNEALDTIEKEHPRLPLILTAEGRTFSAGLDFDYVFPLFARKEAKDIEVWFDLFKKSILRVFTLPRRTIAALNGNAFAGGLILGLACDVRVAVLGASKFSVNEVQVGVPMPATYAEIVRYAVGTAVAREAILDAHVYDVQAAHAKGFVHGVVRMEHLLPESLKRARLIPDDCYSAYVLSKKVLQQPLLQRFESDIPELDRLAFAGLTAEDSLRAQKTVFEKLKQKR